MEKTVEFHQLGLQTRQSAAVAHAQALYADLMLDVDNDNGILRKRVAEDGRLSLIALTECLTKLGHRGPPRRNGYQFELTPTSVMRILAMVGREWRGIAQEIAQRNLSKIDEQYRRINESDPMSEHFRDDIKKRGSLRYRENFGRMLLEDVYASFLAGIVVADYLVSKDITFKMFLEARYENEGGKRFYFNGDVSDHWGMPPRKA